MRICMVGYGRIAGTHSQSLARISGVELDTVVGLRPETTEAFAHQHHYAHVTYDLREAVERPDLDAMVICTPNAFHAEQTWVALQAGKHVLCELPLALSLHEAEDLAELAERMDRRLMVCHTERFEAGKTELRRRIAQGKLHPQHVIGRFHFLRRGKLISGLERSGWVDNVLWHHGCHTVDAILDSLGEAETVDLRAQCGPPWPGLDAPIDWDLQWRTPGGILVDVTLSHNDHWRAHDYRVIALEDTLMCERGQLSNQGGVLVERDEERSPNFLQDSEFVAAVREGREPVVGPAAFLPTMRVLQAAWDVYQRA